MIIGIDVGGSATKIVGFKQDGSLLCPLFVRATDPITSVYGALGRFTAENGISLSSIDRIMVTGAGSSFIGNEIYKCPCTHVSEFESVGRGGLYLSKLKEAVVVSMGTGTALVYAKEGTNEYLGGTGVGGGTLVGLSRELLKMNELSHVEALAKEGNLRNIDLWVSDIAKNNGKLGLPSNLTASNFGNVSDMATKSDTALGLYNLVFETIGMISMFAAKSKNIKDIVLTGRLSTSDIAKNIFESLNHLFDLHFIIPEHSEFGTVIGAALSGSFDQKNDFCRNKGNL